MELIEVYRVSIVLLLAYLHMEVFGDSLVFCILSTILCLELFPLCFMILLVTYVSFDEDSFKKPLNMWGF